MGTGEVPEGGHIADALTLYNRKEHSSVKEIPQFFTKN